MWYVHQLLRCLQNHLHESRNIHCDIASAAMFSLPGMWDVGRVTWWCDIRKNRQRNMCINVSRVYPASLLTQLPCCHILHCWLHILCCWSTGALAVIKAYFETPWCFFPSIYNLWRPDLGDPPMPLPIFGDIVGSPLLASTMGQKLNWFSFAAPTVVLLPAVW